MFEDRVAKALAEEGFVAYENVRGPEFARGKLVDEAVGLGESADSVLSSQFPVLSCRTWRDYRVLRLADLAF
jgi:hypothetical protein